MGAIRVTDSLSDLLGDTRKLTHTFSGSEDFWDATFPTLGTTNFFLMGYGIEPSSIALGIPTVSIDPDTPRTATTARFRLSNPPGGADSYRVGIIISKA